MAAEVEEQAALVDESGAVTGSAPRSVMRRDNLPHAVVAVLVRDSAGRVYVHRRTPTKDVYPGLHDCWVAGVMAFGEEPGAAAARELEEELGIRGVELRPLFDDWYVDKDTRQFCHGYTTTYDGRLIHQESEIAWGGWMTLDELRERLADRTWPFVPDGRAFVTRWLTGLDG